MTITSFSSCKPALSHQRSGATPVAILPDGRIIAEIGKDIFFPKKDFLVVERLRTQLEELTKKYPEIRGCLQKR